LETFVTGEALAKTVLPMSGKQALHFSFVSCASFCKLPSFRTLPALRSSQERRRGNKLMETIAILGTGLMGSSLGLALRKRGVPVRIHAYARRPEVREAALNLGSADAVFADPWDAVSGADIVVFCVPVLTIPKLAAAKMRP